MCGRPHTMVSVCCAVLAHNCRPQFPLYPSSTLQCALCGSKIHSLAEAHLDHIIPFSKGGPSEEGNAQLVHRFCNSSKGNKSDEEARWAMLASCNDF